MVKVRKMGAKIRAVELLNVSMVLQAFWQILLLRKSPEIIPYSHLLLGIALVLHVLVGVGSALLNYPAELAVIQAVIGTLLLVGFSYLLLSVHGLRNRQVQTVTTLAGCELVIGLISLPVTKWFLSVGKDHRGLPALLSLLILGWYLAVVAHIWRNALGVSKGLSYFYAIAYVLISLQLTHMIQALEG